MKIFVSGFPASGKTTLLKNIFEEFENKIKIDGFLTLEIRKNNIREGFKIFWLKNKQEFIFASKNIKTSICYAGYYLDLNALENVIDKIDLNVQLLIIDEIGKMEMLSKKFENFIKKVLNSEINLLASVHRSLINLVKGYGEIFWINKENRNMIYEKIKNKIKDLSSDEADNRKVVGSNPTPPNGRVA